jgi:hypothetical protein
MDTQPELEKNIAQLKAAGENVEIGLKLSLGAEKAFQEGTEDLECAISTSTGCNCENANDISDIVDTYGSLVSTFDNLFETCSITFSPFDSLLN